MCRLELMFCEWKLDVFKSCRKPTKWMEIMLRVSMHICVSNECINFPCALSCDKMQCACFALYNICEKAFNVHNCICYEQLYEFIVTVWRYRLQEMFKFFTKQIALSFRQSFYRWVDTKFLLIGKLYSVFIYLIHSIETLPDWYTLDLILKE